MALLLFLLIAAVIFVINSLQMKRSAARNCRAVLDRLRQDCAALPPDEKNGPRCDELEQLTAQALQEYNSAAEKFNEAIAHFPGRIFREVIHAEPFELCKETEQERK